MVDDLAGGQEAIAVVRRAVELRRRIDRCRLDKPIALLAQMVSELESALLDTGMDGELWAWGVLALKAGLRTAGRYHEYNGWLHRALEVAKETETQQWLWCAMAEYLHTYQQPHEALEVLDARAPVHGSPQLCIYHNHVRCVSLARARRFDEGLALASDGLEFALAQGSELGQCLALSDSCMLFIFKGDYRNALIFSQRLLANPGLLAQDTDFMARQCTIAARICLRDFEAALRECSIFEQELVSIPQLLDIRISTLHNKLVAALALTHWDGVLQTERQIHLLARKSNRSLGLSRLKMFRALVWAFGPRQDPGLLSEALDMGVLEDSVDNAILLRLSLALIHNEPYEGEVIDHPLVRRELMGALVGEHGALNVCIEMLCPFEKVLFERFLGTGVSVHVRGDFEAVSFDGQTWVDLRRKRIGRRILQTLAGAAPKAVDAWSLFEAVWPDATVRSADDLNRLYAAIHRLKAAGLARLLSFDGAGYRWACSPHLRRVG